MDTVTHALLPVIAVGLAAPRARWLGRWGLLAIGVAGALPDLLSPHLSLQARMASWSHGLPCWALFSVLVLLLAVAASRGRGSIRLAGAMSAAYLLHLVCDGISGGVNFLGPVGDWYWGDYWVAPVWWVPLDVACLLTCYFMFRVIPGWRARQAAKPGAVASS